MWKQQHFLFGEPISCHSFLNKYSKKLFDYCVGIHRRKEDFLKKKNVHVMNLLSYIKECQRSLQLLKNKSRISLGKLVITTISIVSSKKKNNFWSRYFRRVVIFGGLLLLAFANTCEILLLLLKGCYFKGAAVTLGSLR